MAYFEIGVFNPRRDVNIGTLWRSAYQLGAAGIFTIGQPYRRQTSDTALTPFQIPLRNFGSMEEFLATRPVGAVLVGVEMGGQPLAGFQHPACALYLLGAEDGGLPLGVIAACNALVSIEAVNKASYNVAVAGSIVMYHRLISASA